METDVRRNFEEEGAEPTEPVALSNPGGGVSLIILTVLFLRFTQFLHADFSILPAIGQCHFIFTIYTTMWRYLM